MPICMQRRKPMIEVIDDDMASVFRSKSGAERLRIVDRLYRSARKLIEANVRSRHPEWDAQEVQRAVAARIAGGAD